MLPDDVFECFLWDDVFHSIPLYLSIEKYNASFSK
jgi:hypothetical protein